MMSPQEIKLSLEEEARSINKKVARAEKARPVENVYVAEDALEEVVGNVKDASQKVKVSVSALVKNPLQSAAQILNEVKENLPTLDQFVRVTWVLAFWEIAKLVYIMFR